MRPDYIIGFNDSDYDYPFLINKVKSYKMEKWFYDKLSMVDSYIGKKQTQASAINNFNYIKKDIKLPHGQLANAKFLKFVGCIPLDIRTSLRKSPVKSKLTSLKYYLNENKLGISKKNVYLCRVNFKIT